MRIISEKTLFDFAKSHADILKPLQEWVDKVNEANWKNFADIKNTFGSVDYVGNDRFVFDIKGNAYRIVALVFFVPKSLVYIRFINTHAEYDKIPDCSTL